jgi:hypothetical protein
MPTATAMARIKTTAIMTPPLPPPPSSAGAAFFSGIVGVHGVGTGPIVVIVPSLVVPSSLFVGTGVGVGRVRGGGMKQHHSRVHTLHNGSLNHGCCCRNAETEMHIDRDICVRRK